jgi:hypothetical protein
MLKHQSAVPATLTVASKGKPFPPMLEQVVARMLAKSPSKRYQTMEEAAEDLQAIIEGRAPRQVAPPPPPEESPQAMTPQTMAQPAVTMPPGQAPLSGAVSSRDLRRPAEQVMTARASRLSLEQDAQHGDDDEAPEFQGTLPPYFMRLMVSSVAVLLLVLGAMGFWWIKQGPKPTSPTTLDLGTPMPGPGSVPGNPGPKSAD